MLQNYESSELTVIFPSHIEMNSATPDDVPVALIFPKSMHQEKVLFCMIMKLIYYISY